MRIINDLVKFVIFSVILFLISSRAFLRVCDVYYKAFDYKK